ncbi:hypothetical protein [Halorhabdus amylolytica]|uniref:hypothetical protein n=1 Tax=Halorhabdus amylolytica TaxID=2559573 RepID=UPI0010AA1B67|nr:hypothetical protein [Halorhabdus amylolytica]
MTDAARGPDGKWRINRTLLGASAVALGVAIVAVFPLRVVPSPWFADSLLHFSGGLALTLGLAAIVPRRDDLLALLVVLLGVLWEPVEAVHYGRDTLPAMADWMTNNDTLKDMSLVAVGALVALVAIGRYE